MDKNQKNIVSKLLIVPFLKDNIRLTNSRSRNATRGARFLLVLIISRVSEAREKLSDRIIPPFTNFITHTAFCSAQRASRISWRYCRDERDAASAMYGVTEIIRSHFSDLCSDVLKVFLYEYLYDQYVVHHDLKGYN